MSLFWNILVEHIRGSDEKTEIGCLPAKFQILDDNIPIFSLVPFDLENRPSVEYLNSYRRKLFHPRMLPRRHASLPLTIIARRVESTSYDAYRTAALPRRY